MSATNSTLNYQLPQFIATDKPAWLVDFNGAMSTIDTAIKEAKTAGDNAQQTANTNTTNIATLDGTVTSQGTAIGALTTSVAGNTGSINTINSLIGNGEPTTTDKTIIGAINEINAHVGAVQAEDVEFNNANTGLVATDVQAAIVEVKGLIPAGPGSVDADDVSYDNTSSGLTATNVQDAIDEVNDKIVTQVLDLDLINNVTATVTAGTGITVNSSEIHVLTNAAANIGKVYGGLDITLASGSYTANVDITVATISASNLPTIQAAYDIFYGYMNMFNASSLASYPTKLKLHFNTNGTVDVILTPVANFTESHRASISLQPCLLFLKDLGD